MACSISVGSVSVNQGGQVTVQGSLQIFTPCGGQPVVTVSLTCGSNTYNTTATLQQITPTFYTYTATVQTTCTCGNAVSVVVTNTCGGYTCQGNFSGTLCCCPTVTTTFSLGLCNNSGKRFVNFQTTVVINDPGCTFTVQRDFGDGSFGTAQTYTGISTNTYNESHPYTTNAGYTSTISISPNCGSGLDPKQFSLSPCPPCNTKPFLSNFLCPIARFIFLVFGPIGLMMFLFLPVCNTASSGVMAATGLGFLILAVIALAIIIFFCYQCLCAALIRLFFQFAIIFGFIFLMFCPPSISSCQPPYSLTTALGIIGGGILFLFVLWYIARRFTCPLTICHFWDVMVDTCTKGVFAIIIGFLVINGIVPLACNPIGFFISLTFLLLLLNISNQMIITNQNNGNCPNYP